MKRLIVATIAALALGAVTSQPALAASPQAAKQFIDTLASQVLDIVKNDGLGKADKQAKIENLFSDKVDVDFIAKFVLGKHWRTANAEQQQSYIAAYRPFIMKNYAGRLTRYSGQTYALKNARADGDATIVTMEILDPNGQNVNLDYRLAGAGSNFKILDISVEGVSLLSTQRSEFNGIVERKGVDGLIEALKKQVAKKG